MKNAKDFLGANLQQAQDQEDAGIHRGDTRKEQEMSAVELRGAVENLAKR
jgi:hypothetical protein